MDLDDVGDVKPGGTGDVAERGAANPRPGKPLSDLMFGFPTQQFVTQRCNRWIDLGDHDATRCEQVGAAPQGPHGVATDADVAVGEQDLIPASLSWPRRGWRFRPAFVSVRLRRAWCRLRVRPIRVVAGRR